MERVDGTMLTNHWFDDKLFIVVQNFIFVLYTYTGDDNHLDSLR